MRKLIKVEQKHISKGVRHSWESCPVARAVKDTFNCDTVFVGAGTVRFGGKMVVAPRSVNRFISRFDQKKPVKPFNFYLTY